MAATASVIPQRPDLEPQQTVPSPPASEPAAAVEAPAPLTEAQIAIVKSTAPVLREHGVAITTLFYDNMLAAYPELRNMFNAGAQATGAQPRALAAAVLAYATYVDDLPKLQHAVERIAHKHASLQVQPEQYAIVGKYLLEAIGLVLGEAATPEIVDAWTAAYGVLAAVFVGRERQLYRQAEEEQGGWTGWRRFRIVRREPESASIESFYLAPADGATPLPGFLPGQYVSLQVFAPELGHLQSRQYSLSMAPRPAGDCYRISVKRDPGETPALPGLISNLLHDKFRVGDEVELSHPQGEFFVDPGDRSKAGAPLVLISAGVGATPIMSILDAVTRAEKEEEEQENGSEARAAARRPISWLHASHSRSVQPFADAVRLIQHTDPGRIVSHVFLHEVGPEDRAGVDYDFGGGRMDLARVEREKHLFTSDPRAEYYICGPSGFMVDMRRSLEEMGVDGGRVHLELFATGDIE